MSTLNPIVTLIPKDENIRQSTKQFLLDAAEQNFESAVIIGKRADGTVTVMNSGGTHLTELLGAMELAMHDLIYRSQNS